MFCSIQEHFIRDIRTKFGIPNSPKSPDIRQNSDRCISIFLDFWSITYKKNCYNSRTSNDIDMKLGSETKLDKRIKTQ